MESEKFSIKISPEVLNGDLFASVYTASTIYNLPQNGIPTSSTPFTAITQDYVVYSGMSEILSGGTNGDSLLTGLTIPVFFTQTYNDIGYYSEFDGLMYQKDIVTNFLYSGDDTTNLFSVSLYNTSGDFTESYLDFTTFSVDWGDGSTSQILTTSQQNHVYTNPGNYVITLSGANPWGVTTVSKPITIPLLPAFVPNPNGTIVFTPQGGNWTNIPVSSDYIFPLDSNISATYQASSNWTTVPFVVSGGYTIENITYFDLPDGKTFYVMNSDGLKVSDLNVSVITKNEQLLDFVMAPQIQTDIYVERGKYSAFEVLERLGEVDNIGDLEQYGYGFFKINNA